MKISIERGNLLKAVSQAQSVVERRNTIPILANVLIEAEGDTVQFRATDLDIEVVDKTPAMVERAGATTVSATTLHEIVRKLPDGALVTLTDDGASGRLTVEAGRSNFLARNPAARRLPGDGLVRIPLELFGPCPGAAPPVRQIQIRNLDGRDPLLPERRLHARRGQRKRQSPALCGDRRPPSGTHRRGPARGLCDMPGVIVPRKTVGELRKLLDDDEMQIAVSVSETKVRFATPDITLTSKVIDGTFPDYTRVIPQGNTRKLEVDATEFAQAVDRVATVSSERSRAVKLQLDEDKLVLSVNAPDSGAAEEELAVAYGDERLEIGFNAKYLLEIASQVDRENAVFMFNSAGDPTLMREGNDTSAVYVVMPMRV